MKVFSKTWVAIKAHKIISIIILIVVLGGGYYTYKKVSASNQPTQYVLAAVSRGTLISSVEGTGQVSAENQLDVTPQGSGKITSVNVKQGDSVKAGQTIAVIDESSAIIALNQAKASLESAQASYDKLINGATSVNVNQGQLSVSTAEQDLEDTTRSSYTDIDNLIRTDLDQFFASPTSFSPQFQISFTDSSSGSNVTLTPSDQNQILNLNSERVNVTHVLSAWANDISSTSTLDAATMASRARGYLDQINTFATDISNAVNSIYLNQSKYQTNLNSFKTDAANARATVNTNISSIQNGQQTLANTKASLAITTAPPRPEDVTAASVTVKNAQSAVQTAQNNYNHNIVSAPFAGEIAALNVHVGDLASAATIVATLTTPQKLAEISLNEVDVAKIAIGNKATLTFDALPDLTVSGTVAEINTIGTVTQGVVDYTVKVGLDTQDERILPGMSVGASIITSSKSDVIIVPSSAIKTVGGSTHVQQIPGQTATGNVSTKIPPINIAVVVGASNDTETEIVSGLNEGDIIVVRTISGSANVATASSANIFSGGKTGGGGNSASRVSR